MSERLDAAEMLAAEEAIALSAEIIEQLARQKDGTLIAVLNKAGGEAATALHDMIEVDPFDGEAVRKLQTVVRRYTDLIRWLQSLSYEGYAASKALDEAEKDYVEFLDLSPEDRRELRDQGRLKEEPEDR